jgi:hypothetical protein
MSDIWQALRSREKCHILVGEKRFRGIGTSGLIEIAEYCVKH